jgi:hypothetical protein
MVMKSNTSVAEEIVWRLVVQELNYKYCSNSWQRQNYALNVAATRPCRERKCVKKPNDCSGKPCA